MLAVFHPWIDRYIHEGEDGLLAWVDLSNEMFKVFSNLHKVNNEKEKVNLLMKDIIDYNGFYAAMKQSVPDFFRKSKDDIIGKIHYLTAKYARHPATRESTKLSIVIPVYNGK